MRTLFVCRVAPLLCIGTTSFVAISTLTSDMNFYTKLISKVDPLTNLPVFKSIQIQLACQACIDAEKAHECVHLQHLIPRWQVTFRARWASEAESAWASLHARFSHANPRTPREPAFHGTQCEIPLRYRSHIADF